MSKEEAGTKENMGGKYEKEHGFTGRVLYRAQCYMIFVPRPTS